MIPFLQKKKKGIYVMLFYQNIYLNYPMHFVSCMYLVFYINDNIVKSFSFVFNDMCPHLDIINSLRGIVLLKPHNESCLEKTHFRNRR